MSAPHSRFIRRLLILPILAAALVAPAWGGEATARSMDLARLGGDRVGPELADRIVRGEFDARFDMTGEDALLFDHRSFWVRVTPRADWPAGDAAALVIRNTRDSSVTLYRQGHAPERLNRLAPEHGAPIARDALVFALDHAPRAGEVWYLHFDTAPGMPVQHASLDLRSLDETRAASLLHTRLNLFAFGALSALTVSALFIWNVMRERAYLYFAATVGFESLWILYSSGEGFAMPVFDLAAVLGPGAWNSAGALATASLCRMVQELTGLSAHTPRFTRSLSFLSAMFAALALPLAVNPPELAPLLVAGGTVLLGVATLVISAIIAVAWRRGARSAGYFMAAWLFVFGFIASMIVWRSLGNPVPDGISHGFPLIIVATAIVLTIGLADRMREQRHALQEARRRAATDPLTGVLNRRSIIDHLHAVVEEASATDAPVSLLFVDLDHFKSINDTYGHIAGDACLKAIVAPIHAELRQTDAIGRYGGEEFVIVLDGASTEAAHAVAERVRTRIAGLQVENDGRTIALTCSIGVASSEIWPLSGRTLVAEADRAVYAAKHAGRNRVHIATATGLAPLV